MRPILLSGHERALTQVKYNPDGDLIASTAKDQHICLWSSHNGERIGTYHGHQGAIWTVDFHWSSNLLASGSADNTIKLWNVQTGECLQTWEFPTAVKRVEFNAAGTKLLGVTEKRMGHLGSIVVLNINYVADEWEPSSKGYVADPKQRAAQDPEKAFIIWCSESKATVAGWSKYTAALGTEYIVAGHEDGSVSLYHGLTGEDLINVPVHELGVQVTDLQWNSTRDTFITASKDKTAKLIAIIFGDKDYHEIEVKKTYYADTPLNSAAITPSKGVLPPAKVKHFVILGGGQAAMDVTTTSARQGKFEARFYHEIFEDEIGRVRGHFGPLNTVAADPTGRGYCSGGEDGYVRVHFFDPAYFDFLYEVEREHLNRMN